MSKLKITADAAASMIIFNEEKVEFVAKIKGKDKKNPEGKQPFTSVFRDASLEQFGFALNGKNGFHQGASITPFYMQCSHGKHFNLTLNNNTIKENFPIDLTIIESIMKRPVDCPCAYSHFNPLCVLILLLHRRIESKKRKENSASYFETIIKRS